MKSLRTLLAFLILAVAATSTAAQAPEEATPIARPEDKILGISIVHDPVHTAQTLVHLSLRAHEIFQRAQVVAGSLQNLESIDEWLWRDAAGVFHELNHILVQREGIVFPRPHPELEEMWLETFQIAEPVDYGLYPAGSDDLARQRVRRTVDTLWGALRATRHHTVRLNDGQSGLETIKELMELVRGNHDSGQARAQIEAFSAEEIAGVRHLLAVQTNAQLIATMHEIATRAQAAEALDAWIAESRRPLTGFGRLRRPPGND